SLARPDPTDDVFRIQDVPDAEHHAALGKRALERLQRRDQFALGTTRHVIHQENVGAEIHEPAAQQVGAESNELSVIDPELRRFPATRGDLADRRKLDDVHPVGKLEEWSYRRIGEEKDIAVRIGSEKRP